MLLRARIKCGSFVYLLSCYKQLTDITGLAWLTCGSAGISASLPREEMKTSPPFIVSAAPDQFPALSNDDTNHNDCAHSESPHLLESSQSQKDASKSYSEAVLHGLPEPLDSQATAPPLSNPRKAASFLSEKAISQLATQLQLHAHISSPANTAPPPARKYSAWLHGCNAAPQWPTAPHHPFWVPTDNTSAPSSAVPAKICESAWILLFLAPAKAATQLCVVCNQVVSPAALLIQCASCGRTAHRSCNLLFEPQVCYAGTAVQGTALLPASCPCGRSPGYAVLRLVQSRSRTAAAYKQLAAAICGTELSASKYCIFLAALACHVRDAKVVDLLFPVETAADKRRQFMSFCSLLADLSFAARDRIFRTLCRLLMHTVSADSLGTLVAALCTGEHLLHTSPLLVALLVLHTLTAPVGNVDASIHAAFLIIETCVLRFKNHLSPLTLLSTFIHVQIYNCAHGMLPLQLLVLYSGLESFEETRALLASYQTPQIKDLLVYFTNKFSLMSRPSHETIINDLL